MMNKTLNIQNLLKRSNELDVSKGIKEWDLVRPEFGYPGQCDYCKRKKVNLRFKLINIINGNEMLVGFVCLQNLKKMGLTCVSEDNYLMDENDIENYINDCWHIFKKEIQKKKTIKYLEELNKYIDIQDTINIFKKTGFFDMYMVITLLAYFQEFNIYYDNTMFNINLGTKAVKQEFLEIDQDHYALLYNSLTNYQRKLYEEQ